MIIAALSTWIVFCIRDYCLLHTGRVELFRRHARWYAVSNLIAATLVCIILRTLGPARTLEVARSPRILGIALVCHAIATALCLWLARHRDYNHGWVLALAPLPAPWISLVITATSLYSGGNGGAAAGFVLGVTAAWIVILVGAMRLDQRDVPSEEQSFSFSFAGWSNCMACCFVPLMIQSA
ncbi:MAG: hypothetical protein QOJ99_5254 [Bryobacterales bacterium]|jgi:hypothetical protein|nr:hypothetical protein [Bryobacterales bacterium]